MAYQFCVASKEDRAEGGLRVIFEFVGTSGEPSFKRERVITGADTIAGLQEWAFEQVQRQAPVKTIADQMVVGVLLSIKAPPDPPDPPAPTDKEVWLEKVQRLQSAKAIGVSKGAAVADITALQDDIENTYVTGYLS